MYLLINQAEVKKHNIIILIIMKMIEIVIVIIKRGWLESLMVLLSARFQ